MKWISFILFFIFGLTLTQFSFSSLEPFKKKIGGRITTITYCPLPIPHLSYTTIQTNIGSGSGSWAWIPGASINYLYGPPSHPGQPILGLASDGYMSCLAPTFWGVTPVGPPSFGIELYHGSGA